MTYEISSVERSLEGGNIRGTDNDIRQELQVLEPWWRISANCMLNIGSTARVRPKIRNMPGIITMDLQVSFEKMLDTIWKKLIMIGIHERSYHEGVP